MTGISTSQSVSTEIVDEVDRVVYLFTGDTRDEVNRQILRWTVRDEPTWESSRPLGRHDEVPISLDDVRAGVRHPR